MTEIEIAILAAKEASKYLLNIEEIKVNANVDKDIKLQADIESEKIIIDILRNNFSYPILAEESGELDSFTTDGKHWIIDPIDGTLNFSKGLPISCISIALYEKEKAILGVIYDFNRDELFSGIVGEGAWLNGQKIEKSNIKESSSAVLATGFPSYRNYDETVLLEFVSKIKDFKKVRLLGSAALSLAYVACGRVDAYSEEDIMLWDVAAGLALVEAVGGYTSIKQGNITHSKLVFCSSDKKIWNGKE